MFALLKELLDIPSPTYQEQKIIDFILQWAKKNLSHLFIEKYGDNLVLSSARKADKKTLAFVGHCDVVPKFFKSYEKDGSIYGAGASDMLGALACFLTFLKEEEKFLKKYNIILIIYSREEGTPLHENGLYELINKVPKLFKTIDFALIGEPSNNDIHLGCLGSLHYQVRVLGEACHSARPWEGTNALYQALPLVQKFSQMKEKKIVVNKLAFYELMQITESKSEKGKTSLPSFWEGNINYRFAPNKSEEDAKNMLETLLQSFKSLSLEYHCSSSVPAGRIINSSFSTSIIKRINRPILAKQAWTDLAQFSQLNIPSINFGPGLTSQAHKKNEFIPKDSLSQYYDLLKNIFT